MKKVIAAVFAVMLAYVSAQAQQTPSAAKPFVYTVNIDYHYTHGNPEGTIGAMCSGVAVANNILLIPSACYPDGTNWDEDSVIDRIKISWPGDVLDWLSLYKTGKDAEIIFDKRGPYNGVGIDLGNGVTALDMNLAMRQAFTQPASFLSTFDTNSVLRRVEKKSDEMFIKGLPIMTFNDNASKNRMFEGRVPNGPDNQTAIFLTSPKGTPVIIAFKFEEEDNQADFGYRRGYTHISKDMAAQLQAMGAEIVNENFEKVTIIRPENGNPYRRYKRTSNGDIDIAQNFEQYKKDNADRINNINGQMEVFKDSLPTT